MANKRALLITYNGETIVNRKTVSVPEDWKESMGPYSELIAFSVGSNQELIEISEETAFHSD